MGSARKKRRRLFLFRKLFLMANIFFVALLALGFAAAFLSPDKYWAVAFAGLAFPYVALINFVFMIFWLFTARKIYALISLLMILISLPRLDGYYQPVGEKTSGDHNDSIRVLSYNVRLFDLYNWGKKKESANCRAQFILIREQKPDVLCIQEYHAGRSGKVDIADSISAYSGLRYKHITFVKVNGDTKPYGIATYSRWPVVNRGMVRFDDNPVNFCIYSDIVRNGDTTRIFNVHLESIRFSREDYLFVNELRKQPDDPDLFSENSRKIIRKLKSAFISRARQARTLRIEIARSPYPVIVCGDFNDTPSSYAYRQMSAGLVDAFCEAGSGFGHTYAGSLPSFRIDYILHDKKYFYTVKFEKINQAYSDHYPIAATLGIHSKALN